MDDIAAGMNKFDEMIPALRKIFDCLGESDLKLSAHNCESWTTKIDYLCSTITPEGISPESAKIEKLFEQVRMPNTVKQVKRLFGFLQFFRNFIPNFGRTLLPFYKLLRKENVFTITNDLHESFNTLNADLTRATDLTLRLAKPGLQYVILFLKTPLQAVSSLVSYPGDTVQIDLVGPLKSPVHCYVLTAFDVFTNYLFAVPLTNFRADTIARALTSIFFRQSYLPKTILSVLGTSFVSSFCRN